MKAGWKVKPLGEVAKLHYGKALAKADRNSAGKIPIYGANGVLGWSDHVLAEGPSLIVGRKGSAGEINRADGPFWPSDVTYYTEHDSGKLDFAFFHYGMITLNIPSLAKGVKPGINRNEAYALDFPIPPLEEQKRIVAVLDAAFEGLTRAEENAKANLQNERELFESGFEAQLENSDAETVICRFGDTNILEIIDGDRGKAYPKKSEFTPSGYCLFLSTKNVREDGFLFNDCQFISEEKDAELRKGKLLRRDVVLTTRGTIGNIGLYDEQVPYHQIRINSGMLILRPNEEVLLSDFLFEALRSRMVRNQIEEQTSGAAQPQLPIRTLRELSIKIPKTLNSQAVLVSSLREHQDGCKELQAHYQTKLTDIADLRQSLLQKAFAGELT